MNLQPYFDQFHEEVKLIDENVDLRTSRDAIKTNLSNKLKELLTEKQIKLPVFFDQGSYAMGTGVKPLSGKTTFDIDEGLIFEISVIDYDDPVEIKKWVADALSEHTKVGTEIKEPCVRVVYSEQDEEKYHVDLAIYTRVYSNMPTPLLLARGKEFSQKESKYWDVSDPIVLKNLINEKFADETRLQFRRVVRYLKRWKDVQFNSAKNGKPTGISLTTAAYYYFEPSFSVDGNPDDLQALSNVVGSLSKQSFNMHGRLEIVLPVQPHNDLLAKMSDKQNEKFQEKLKNLYNDLLIATFKKDINEALSLLAKHFGDDFPISPIGSKNLALVNVPKPKLGYHPSYTDYGSLLSKHEIRLKCFLKLPSQINEIPLVSDKKVLTPGLYLHFYAEYDGDYDKIQWQVVNTGEHARSEFSSTNNSFRGELNYSKMLNANVSKRSPDRYVHYSYNQLETWEHTDYTGKHWMQCLAFKNGTCVAKSKKFYVNILNPKHPNYD